MQMRDETFGLALVYPTRPVNNGQPDPASNLARVRGNGQNLKVIPIGCLTGAAHLIPSHFRTDIDPEWWVNAYIDPRTWMSVYEWPEEEDWKG